MVLCKEKLCKNESQFLRVILFGWRSSFFESLNLTMARNLHDASSLRIESNERTLKVLGTQVWLLHGKNIKQRADSTVLDRTLNSLKYCIAQTG
jgi:hypothetical protein